MPSQTAFLRRIDIRARPAPRDPHGDAIPDAAGHVHRTPFVLLASAATGHTGSVLRVSDRDPEVLRAIGDAGLSLGDDVTVTLARDPPHRPTRRSASTPTQLPQCGSA